MSHRARRRTPRSPAVARAIAVIAIAGTGCASDDAELGWTASRVDLADFVLPALSAEERAPIVRAYDWVDPTDTIPRGLLEDALVYFDVNQAHIPNATELVVVDLSRYSGEDRFWIANVTTGEVEPHKVAHGDGSDPENDGYAELFGNVEGSHMSSLGFYLTGEIYDGTHPHSMRLDGLSIDGSPNGMANSNARERLIVVHEADYVDDSDAGQQGRSNGCLALDPAIEADVVDRLHDGSLIYAAISPLAPPVGRAVCGDATCDGAEDLATCPADCGDPEPEPDGSAAGGCSTTGPGASVLWGLALLGLVRRRRSLR